MLTSPPRRALGCALLLGSLAGCGPSAPPPAAPVAQAPSAPAPAPPAASGPLDSIEVKLVLDDDFVRPLAHMPQPRALDEKAVAEALPKPLAKRFSEALAALSAPYQPTPPGKEKRAKVSPTEAVVRELIKASDDKRAEPRQKAALSLAAAYLADRQAVRAGLGEGGRAEAQTMLELAQSSYKAAVEASEPGDSIGKEARYHGGVFLLVYVRGDRGRAWLEQLARSGGAPADALYRLGYAWLTGDDGDPAKAAQSLRTLLEAGEARTSGLGLAALQALSLAEYRQARFAESLKTSVALLAALPPAELTTILGDGAIRIATDSAERLGGAAGLERAEGAPKLPAEVLLRLSWRAVRRHDLAGAERLAQQVIEREPLDWRAAQAQKALVSIAERQGDRPKVDALRAGLAEKFGPRSAWADEQRRRRDGSGKPTEQAIADASLPPGNPKAEEPKVEVEGRVRALVRLCLEPDWWRVPTPSRASEAGVVVEVKATVTPGKTTAVNARLASGEAPLDRTLSCIAQQGPSHLDGAPASVVARVRY